MKHSFQPEQLFKTFKTAMKFALIHFSLNICKREMNLKHFIIEFMHKIPSVYLRVKLQLIPSLIIPAILRHEMKISLYV